MIGRFTWLALLLPLAASGAGSFAPLRVCVAQTAVGPSLEENEAKVVSFVRRAAEDGCRVVVFPEGQLRNPAVDDEPATERSLVRIAAAARRNDIYVILGGFSTHSAAPKNLQWLAVYDPEGQQIARNEKLYNRADATMPSVFHIDGLPVSAVICADRWLRGVEELPIMDGARIAFELSDNFAVEWVPELDWFWYVPRALRNNVFVVFANTVGPGSECHRTHGHSAVISPEGAVLASAESAERLLAVTIDPNTADRREARRRRDHPVLGPFWEYGLQVRAGGAEGPPPLAALTSSETEIKIAAAQMTTSGDIAQNLATMERLITAAAREGADLVVFPELAVSGARPDAVAAASKADLDAARRQLEAAVRRHQIHVVFGMPALDDGARTNAAYAIGPDGSVLTRHDQLVVNRPKLFAAGNRPERMWFRCKGVPVFVTIGGEGLWSELSELAALAGAQVIVHLANESNASPVDAQRRRQVWANLASYGTITATVNAAAPAGGGSAIWSDLRSRVESRLAARGEPDPERGSFEIYAAFSANCIKQAGDSEELLFATVRTAGEVSWEKIRHNPQMYPWFEFGKRLIRGERIP